MFQTCFVEKIKTHFLLKIFFPEILDFFETAYGKKRTLHFCSFFTAALITRNYQNITIYVHCVVCNDILKSKLGLNKSWIYSLYNFFRDWLNIMLILLLRVCAWRKQAQSIWLHIDSGPFPSHSFTNPRYFSYSSNVQPTCCHSTIDTLP